MSREIGRFDSKSRMDERGGISPPKAVGKFSFHENRSSRHSSDSIELRPVRSLPALPSGPENARWLPHSPRTRPTSDSPALERLEGRFSAQYLDEQTETRWSRRFSILSKPSNSIPAQGEQLSRPLTFRDSLWLSEPEKLMLQFQSANEIEPELFDPPHHILSRSKKKRLVYLVSLAAVFSPLSSNIYFPALTAIAEVCIPLISR